MKIYMKTDPQKITLEHCILFQADLIFSLYQSFFCTYLSSSTSVVYFRTQLDYDCKKWRMFADVLNDLAMLIEILTPR